ncbi:unnamed protein product, partial [Allacma fusca]
MENQSI